MACTSIQTGASFLSATLSHVDCQAQTIGSYGFGALASPGSPVFLALSGLLTIFIALFGIRLMLGDGLGPRDLVTDVFKLGIVLTLATSWPAWRIIGYDTVINGPAEIAGAIGEPAGLGDGSTGDLQVRLQRLDDAIVTITIYGSGRLTGGTPAGNALGDSFQGIALADQFALGMGRASFLAGVIGPHAIVRMGAGVLLALAPLMAGLLLFSPFSGVFVGWARGLGFCLIAGTGLSLVQAAELAMAEPWAADVISQRASSTLTPSAPTELLVLAMAFSILSVGMLWLSARIAFFSSLGFQALSLPRLLHVPAVRASGAQSGEHASQMQLPPRAYAIGQAVEATMRREDQIATRQIGRNGQGATQFDRAGSLANPSRRDEGAGSLASNYRRTSRRVSNAASQRDRSR